MDAIDIFVHLLDDQETDRALKLFGETSKSKNTQYKKTKLKMTLRGQDGKTKVNRKSTNPFDFIISSFANKSYKDAAENKLFLDLNYDANSRFSNSEKFATAYLYFPIEVKEAIVKIEDNITKDIYPFTNVFKTSDQDIEEYIKTSLWFNENDFQEDNFQRAIEKNLGIYISDKGVDDELKEVFNDVVDWDLHKLFQSYNKINPGDTANHMYAFMTKHGISNDLKQYMLIELLGMFIRKWYVKAEIYSGTFKEHEECEDTIERLSEKINELKSQIELQNSELQLSKKTIKNLEKSSIQMQNNMEKEKTHLKDEMTNKEKSYQDTNNQLNKKLMDLELKYQRLKANLEFSFTEFDSDQEKFSVLHNFDELHFIQTIYPDILFIKIEQIEDSLRQLDDINAIYIVRQGISSYKIKKIEQLCLKENKTMKLITPVNERELIEEVAIIKKSGGSIQ